VIPQEKYYDPNRESDGRRKGKSFISSTGEALPKRWHVNEMWDVHHEIARRLVLGQNNKEVSEALDISPQTVSIVKNSPVVQEHIAILRGARDADTVDLAKEIQEIAPVALSLLKDIINGDNDGANASIMLRAKTSENMLARVGHGVPHRVQSENIHAFLTSKDIEDIKQRAFSSGNVVEVADYYEQ